MNIPLKIHRHLRQPEILKMTPRYHPYLLALRNHPMTDDELGKILRKGKSNASTRRNELIKLGYVISTNTQRKTSNGKNATVWKLTEKGIQFSQTLERNEK